MPHLTLPRGTRLRRSGRNIRPRADASGIETCSIRRWSSVEGSSYPLGATWIEEEEAFNFAIYSKSASVVRLLLFSAEDYLKPIFVYEFDPLKNKTGPIWHARVPGDAAGAGKYYGYSIDGPSSEFRPHKVLLDPYAKAVFFPPKFDRATAYSEESNAEKTPLGILPSPAPPFDWGSYRPIRHDHDLILYELHVRGFTMNPNSGIDFDHRGTLRGIVEKIPYLKELGITGVEIMPVFEFDETESNYWGYMPLNFFAPHRRFASNSPGQQMTAFKFMVKALHAADIEVILDVVYNHTGEGDELGPTFSFKGIDC